MGAIVGNHQQNLFLISIFKNTNGNQLILYNSKAVHLPIASSLLPILRLKSSRSVGGSSHTLLLRYLVYPLLPSRLCSCEPSLSTPSFY